MTTLLDTFEAAAENDFAAVKTFVTSTVYPELKNLLAKLETDAIAAAKPIITAAIQGVVADAGALNTPAGWFAALESAAAVAFPQLVAAEIKVTYSEFSVVGLAVINDILAVVQAA